MDTEAIPADPETACVGLHAVEISHTGSREKTAAAMSLRQVDAVLGWSLAERRDPETIEGARHFFGPSRPHLRK